MNRKIWFMMFFSFTGSKFSFEPPGLAKASWLHFNSGPTTFVADGFNTNTRPPPWLPRNAIKISMTPDENKRSGATVPTPVLSRHSRCFFQCPLISRTRASLSEAEL